MDKEALRQTDRSFQDSPLNLHVCGLQEEAQRGEDPRTTRRLCTQKVQTAGKIIGSRFTLSFLETMAAMKVPVKTQHLFCPFWTARMEEDPRTLLLSQLQDEQFQFFSFSYRCALNIFQVSEIRCQNQVKLNSQLQDGGGVSSECAEATPTRGSSQPTILKRLTDRSGEFRRLHD